MKKAFPTVIHESVNAFDRIIISGGRIGAQIILAPDDLVRVTRAKIADIIHH
jgi:Cys-tRNA(Pro)/Cys-tRNA(Cys) deacylase